MALLRALTALVAFALTPLAMGAAFAQDSTPAPRKDGQVYRLKIILYEGFTSPPKGVYASFHYGVGDPSIPDYRDKREHLLKTFSLREVMPLASLDMRARGGALARRGIASYANGSRSALDVEMMALPEGERILLDMTVLLDGAEVFHSGTAALPGKLVTIGAEHKATGRKFFLAVTAEAVGGPPDAAPILLKNMRQSPTPEWPEYPAKARAAGERGSLMLDARSGAPTVRWSSATPEMTEAALRAAATWGQAVGFVHFRPGK